MSMDIRSLFKKQEQRNEERSKDRKPRAPVIIDDDDEEDFKPRATKRGGGGGKAKPEQKKSQEGTKRKRPRAKIRYESDSDEDVPLKKSKTSPKKGSRGTGPKTPTKGKEVKSVSDFFGSAPIKRTGFKGIPSTSTPGKKDSKGGGEEERGEEEVVRVSESPTEVCEFDDETVVRALEEEDMETHDDKVFTRTLQELDHESQPSSTPPTKKLKVMMEKLPIQKSPSKTSDKDKDFTDSPVFHKRDSPAAKRSKGKERVKVSPVKAESVEKQSPVKSKARKGITYVDSDKEDSEDFKTKSPPSKKSKPEASPSMSKATTSPRKPVSSTLKQEKTESHKRDQKPVKPEKPVMTTTPKSTKPTQAHDTPTATSATTPKLNRGASYAAYLNRSGPRAPGSKTIPKGEENCLEGLTFVITGVLESLEREVAADLIKKYGGRVTSSISKKTSYLVVGEEAGESKLSKASSLGTEQIDEDGLLDLIRTRPGKKGRGAPSGKKPEQKGSKKPPVKQPTTPEVAHRPLKAADSGPPPSTPKTHPTVRHQAVTPTSSGLTTPPHSHVTTPVAMATPTQIARGETDKRAPATEDLMWVDKYRPQSIKQIIGQQGDKSNAKKLLSWLQQWERNHSGGGGGGKVSSGWGRGGQDASSFKAALLSGPPGVGKTTTATLVCEEVGYSYVELNASANRSKRSLHDEVASHLGCLSISAFLEGGGGVGEGRRHALIMDEVDGMAGNEDRGGVQELISMIKTTRIPIICICNDRQHQKIRSLANYCLDLRFQKPRVDQIRGAMMSVCYKEGVKIAPQALAEIIMASGQDIRQVLHNLSVWCVTDKTLSFEQAKETARSARKEMKLNPFEVIKLVFMPLEGERELSLNERSGLFFHDYSIGPLFVQENYPTVRPLNAKGNIRRTLDLLSLTADSLCEGDLVEKRIRSSSRWDLLPVQAMFSSVLPGALMRGPMGRPEFPQWLGNNSRRGKCDRLLQELQRHTRLMTSCNKTEFGLDYVPFLHSRLTQPLMAESTEGVPEVVATMDAYDLVRDDWDSIVELAHFKGRPEIGFLIPSKVKAVFTRSYNKESRMTPYSMTMVAKRSKPTATELTEENEESEQDSDEDLSHHPMVKGAESGRKGAESSSGKGSGGKGKGKAGGQGGKTKGRGKR